MVMKSRIYYDFVRIKLKLNIRKILNYTVKFSMQSGSNRSSLHGYQCLIYLQLSLNYNSRLVGVTVIIGLGI